jgi:hypothetical protein
MARGFNPRLRAVLDHFATLPVRVSFWPVNSGGTGFSPPRNAPPPLAALREAESQVANMRIAAVGLALNSRAAVYSM